MYLGTYVTVKALSRIERMIMDMQFLNPYGKFIKPENNREKYAEIVYNLEATKIFTPHEIELMRSQIKCVPYNRLNTHWSDNKDYCLFHAKRITDVIINIPTPSNDYNNGITDYGTLTFNIHTPKQTILSSLREVGIISREVQEYLCKYIK